MVYYFSFKKRRQGVTADTLTMAHRSYPRLFQSNIFSPFNGKFDNFDGRQKYF